METNFTEIKSVSYSSDIKHISSVEVLIDDICNQNDMMEDHYGNILIAVTEAVNNAIQHGNANDQSKNFTLSIQQNKEEIQFIIEDEGKGFDYENLPDPTAPENIEKECGRGIFLMKSLADTVVFEKGGARVLLTFERNS